MYTPSAWVVTFIRSLSLSLVYMSHDECTVWILHTLLNCHCSYFDACINLDFMWVLNINNQELLLRINWLESIVHKYTLGPSPCSALNLLIVMHTSYEIRDGHLFFWEWLRLERWPTYYWPDIFFTVAPW